MSVLNKDLDKKTYVNKIKDLKNLPKLVEETLLTESKIQTISSTFTDAKGSMFLGRGFSYPIALEGALKLKRISLCSCRRIPSWRNETWSISFNRRWDACSCISSKR